jgi:hypothetical protein
MLENWKTASQYHMMHRFIHIQDSDTPNNFIDFEIELSHWYALKQWCCLHRRRSVL